MLGFNITKIERSLVYQDLSKSLWIGISLIVAGFLITFWQSIYFQSSGFKEISPLALFLISTSVIGIGFGLIAHHFWKQYREYRKTFKKKGFGA